MSSWLSTNNILNIFDIFKWTSIPTFSIMSGTVFIIFSTICWVFMSKSEMPSYPQRRLSGFYNSMMKPDEDISETDEDMSITELMKSFHEILKLEIEELSENVPQRNRRSSWYLLKVISRKLKTDPNSIIEAAQMNLHILTLNFVIQLLPTAESNKVSVAIDVINCLLQNKMTLNSLGERKEDLISFVDAMLEIIKIYLAITDLYDDDEDLESTATEESMESFFAESGYKFILALGLLVNESSAVKTVCAERGCILLVLDCLKKRKHSSSLSKWCIWALMNICFEHPPNKGSFVHKGGLSAVISTLSHHAMNSDVQKQGLSLLFYILSDDIQSKFHTKDARRTSLALGIVTIIEAAQINFKEEKAIQDPCLYLLQIMAIEVDAD